MKFAFAIRGYGERKNRGAKNTKDKEAAQAHHTTAAIRSAPHSLWSLRCSGFATFFLRRPSAYSAQKKCRIAANVVRKNWAMNILNKTVFLFLILILACGKNGKHDSKADLDNVGVTLEPGSQVFASSADGLFLREGPNTSGRKLAIIPFGERLEVQDFPTAYVVLDNRKGAWAKVKWQNKIGFVFSGFLADDLNTALNGKIFSHGLDCTGLTHSEFTWHLFFLAESRYRMEHISGFDMNCTLKHIAEGRYVLKDNQISLKVESSKNVLKNGPKCPKIIPSEITTGYAYVDSGDYTLTKCDGKAALARGPKDYNNFVILTKSP